MDRGTGAPLQDGTCRFQQPRQLTQIPSSLRPVPWWTTVSPRREESKAPSSEGPRARLRGHGVPGLGFDPTNFGPRQLALHLRLCPVRSERMLQDTPPEGTRLPSAFDFLWLEMEPDSPVQTPGPVLTCTDTWAGRHSRVPGATPSWKATGSPLCWGRVPWTSPVVLSLI